MTQVDRKAILKSMRICRFCLTDEEPLTSIYEKDPRTTKNSVPLPLQIMACVSIEVFQSDGMPQMICKICRLQTVRSYKFKTHCKQSDDALKLFLATGSLKKPSESISEILELEEELQDPLKLPDTFVPSEPVPKRQKKSSNAPLSEQSNANIKLEIVNESQNEQQNVEQVEEGEILQEYIEQEGEGDAEGEMEGEGDAESGEMENLIQDDEMEQYAEFENLDESEIDESVINKLKSGTKGNVATKVFSCTKCDRSFPLQQLLDIHMRNHTRERKFPCRRCNKLFFSKYDLAKHATVHTGEKPYQCVACFKSFARPTLLHRHEKIHVELPKYLCSTCDRTFLAKEELERHEHVHRKSRPYPCNLCDKSFAFKQGLERHQETHRVNKPHKCNYCDESFDTPAKLARHVTSHAGIRPYPCKFCHRTFLLSHHLTRHLRGHYAQETNRQQMYNYKCSECTMQFKRKDGLIGHSTIHSMVSLKCIFCFKQFDGLRQVQEHVKTHMYGRIYPCEKCNYSFITQKHLEDHEQNSCTGNLDQELDEFDSYEAANQNNESINIFNDPLNADDDEEGDQTQQETMSKNTDDIIVRRSSRPTKIKDYAKFIKDELGSESEHGSNDDEESVELSSKEPMKKGVKRPADDTIKPIVKPDGTKTYASKGPKRTATNTSTSTTTSTSKTVPNIEPQTPSATTQSSTPVNIDLPDTKLIKGEIMEMKIGEKVVKVQKLLMSKAEVEEMARQGKLKMKGGAMVLKQPVNILKKSFDVTKLRSPLSTSTPLKVKKLDTSETNIITPTSEQDQSDTKKSVRTYTKKTSTTPAVVVPQLKIKEEAKNMDENTESATENTESAMNVTENVK